MSAPFESAHWGGAEGGPPPEVASVQLAGAHGLHYLSERGVLTAALLPAQYAAAAAAAAAVTAAAVVQASRPMALQAGALNAVGSSPLGSLDFAGVNPGGLLGRNPCNLIGQPMTLLSPADLHMLGMRAQAQALGVGAHHLNSVPPGMCLFNSLTSDCKFCNPAHPRPRSNPLYHTRRLNDSNPPPSPPQPLTTTTTTHTHKHPTSQPTTP
ncbi:hypothetical protein T492DRAFT_833229 [Pavlovales sp. CCMP2436]|nr:hypothetical protein T492DRAFT_833229 [Pavlovales sp. CCMP2436]